MQTSHAPKTPPKNRIPQDLRVLLVGGGGREHALAIALKQSKSVRALFTTHPSNPGIKGIAQPMDHELDLGNLTRVASFCDRERINLVVVGPEGPLEGGIVDELSSADRAVFGPTKAGAQIEADKAFAKQLMRSASIPTADARVVHTFQEAKAYIDSREEPPVVKASGLAAGKGVVVAKTKDEALDAARAMMVDKRFGDAGATLVLEERMTGPEVSVFALVDGHTILTLDVCQDYKRLLDDDRGPNTGGMGAICPSPRADARFVERIERDIIVPTVDALRREGITYRGVLYAGLMLTHAGPKVVEFNCRFGDPEAQVLLQRLAGDVGRVCYACAVGGMANLEAKDLSFRDGAACTVVLASEGYPEKPVTGVPIEGIEEAEAISGVTVHHAGTARKDGQIVTAGGRVLNVTAFAEDAERARELAYEGASKISFAGMQMRTDIGALKPSPVH
ncbi:MAG: phosphoribosylamine--glycine ligase [Phycisphaerales bacterium]